MTKEIKLNQNIVYLSSYKFVPVVVLINDLLKVI